MAKDFIIRSVDYEPADLSVQLPLYLTLDRSLPGCDRPDYWLATLEEPIRWAKENEPARHISHLILCSRYEGESMTPDLKEMTVGIAYVTDDAQLSEDKVDFNKCEYVAIGRLERAGNS